MRVKRFVVHRHDDGIRLGSFVRMKVSPEFSGKNIQEAIHNGMCRINGRVERFASYRIAEGERVEVDLSKLREQTTRIFSPKILFEDEYFVCVNKPPGMVCDPKQFPQLFLVHRLDKETSGCLLLAKSKQVQERSAQLFKERSVGKVYVAVVYGKPKAQEWTTTTCLRPIQSCEGMTVYGSRKTGKEATTHFQVMKTYTTYTLMKCVPKTGRTHQIRVHLSDAKVPIVGDVLYGVEHRIPHTVKRHLLHAYALQFTHPYSSKKLKIVAPLPSDINTFIKSLGD